MESQPSRCTLFKRATIGGIALFGATTFPVMRHAAAQNGDTELVCISDGVRIRAEAGMSAAIRGSVSSGDVVWLTGASVEADGYSWIPVTVQGSKLAG